MGRHARAGQSPRRAHIRIAVIVAAVCLVAGGTAAAVTVGRGGHSDDSSGTSAACPNGSVTVEIRADPSAVSWLGTLAGRYADLHHQVDGRCVRPKVDSVAFAAAGSVVRPTPYPGAGPAPDVWVPDSTSAFDILRAQSDNAEVIPKTAPSIATSPLVLAAPAQTVTEWQRDGADRDLSALLTVGSNGAASLSMPDPASTGAGIATVLAATAKVTGSTVSSATYRTSTARFGLIQLGSHTTVAPDGAALLSKAAASASADHLVAVSEHDVWQYNKTHAGNRLQSYNAFGATRATDYPYAIVNGNWVTGRIRAAATDFGKWLSSSATQDSLTEFGLRQADGSAGGLSGPGIDGAHGKLDPAPAVDAVTSAHSAWTLLTTHRSVLSLIDVSASMSNQVPGTTQSKLVLARNTASDALSYFTDDDAIGLSEFSTSIDGGPNYKVLVPLGQVGKAGTSTDRRTALRTAYQNLQPQHGTALYDSVLQAFEDAQQNYLTGAINMVIVLTDGEDANSSIDLPTLLTQLKQKQNSAQPVHIVTIAYGSDANVNVLKQIAAATGGASFAAPDPRAISTVFISALSALAQ